MTFIDDILGIYTYLVMSKYEVLKKFLIYRAKVKNQIEKKINILIFDR